MKISWYSSLYKPCPTALQDLGWSDLIKKLSTFTVTANKFSVPGFGLHVLSTPARKAEYVTEVTAFGFDVDAGTPTEVARSVSLLRDAGLAAHVYSSHSHTPEKPALRFILPSNRPMLPTEYPRLRLHLIRTFKIPCKADQSGDASRFWFLPSHPPGRTPYVETLDGDPVDVDACLAVALPTPLPKRRALSAAKWSPPPEPQTPVDLTPLRERLSLRAAALLERYDSYQHRKGELLQLLLDGKPLAEHGDRNNTMVRTAAIVVYALPPATPLSALLALSRPSLLAMQAEGSSLNETKVERMFLTAMARRAEAESLATLKEQIKTWSK